jgi:putative ATPase
VDLFDPPAAAPATPALPGPLADRMRPRTLDEVVGQGHLIGPGKVLRRSLEEGRLHSMILWGPPGTGKTTLALLMAQVVGARFVTFSAVLAGVKEIRQVMAEAEADRARRGRRTILFVDEIHRFNKAQQDAFLPYVERGDIVLVGATTENPSFEVNAALLSRCRVYVLQPLAEADLVGILERALIDRERGLGNSNVTAEPDALRLLTVMAGGDARNALNILELAVELEAARAGTARRLTAGAIREAAQKKALLYDKAGEEHYNLISALHKSMRESDPDATIYWLVRMLEAGEDPLYVARRIVRFASEDVGLADPRALRIALDAKEAFEFLGMPEGSLALVESAVYCAMAPKSNALYEAEGEVKRDVAEKPAEPVPQVIRNAVTKLMKDVGYGRGYRYAPAEPEGVGGIECLPEGLRGRRYYRPRASGEEAELSQRLEGVLKLRQEKWAREAADESEKRRKKPEKS